VTILKNPHIFPPGQVTHYNVTTFEKSSYFSTGQVTHYNVTILKKSLYFSTGQVTHYNVTILKNPRIFYPGQVFWEGAAAPFLSGSCGSFLKRENDGSSIDGFRFRVFLWFKVFCGFSNCAKLLPQSIFSPLNFSPLFLYVLWPLFIGKVAWSPKHIGPSTSLFFVNFDFLFIFFCIFESEQYQRRFNKENQWL